MKNSTKIGYMIFAFAAISLAGGMKSCSTTKKAKPCTQCPSYTKQIESLKKKITIDSMTLEQASKDYYELWEENQTFSSMLAEIENEPGGHEILEKLWQKNN